MLLKRLLYRNRLKVACIYNKDLEKIHEAVLSLWKCNKERKVLMENFDRSVQIHSRTWNESIKNLGRKSP